jgi:hypothetical protein
VQRSRGNEDEIAGADRLRLPVQHRRALALDEEEDLVAVVRLLADLLARLDRHDDDLAVLAGRDRPPEGVVLTREVDVVHGCHRSLLVHEEVRHSGKLRQ